MKLKELNRTKGGNRWCGPAVISFISGISTDEASLLVRSQTGRRKVTGIYTAEVDRALRALGYKLSTLQTFKKGKKPTLAGWLRDSVEIRKPGRVFLISAGNHWQLITGRRYACGIVGEIVSIKHPKVKRRARVEAVYEVHEMWDSAEQTRATRAHLEATKAKRKKVTNQRTAKIRKVRNIAARHDIGIDVDDYGGGSVDIFFNPPQWVWDLREEGEVDFNGVAYDWDDALDSVQTIAEIIQIHE